MKVFLLIILSMFLSCSDMDFSISYIDEQVKIDGDMKDKVWSKCNTHNQFFSPWSDLEVEKTEFRTYHDKSYLYYHFKIEDQTLNCFQSADHAESVEYSDRAEIFFSVDSLMSKYYGIEIDACGRMIEFKSEGYRNFDKTWSFPSMDYKDYQVLKSSFGYQVEGRISLQALEEMEVLKDGKLLVGIFRANFLEAGSKKKVQWISWKPIQTKKPNFHHISGFRTVNLGD